MATISGRTLNGSVRIPVHTRRRKEKGFEPHIIAKTNGTSIFGLS